MPTYVAFLRAINLGAKRKFPKDAIKVATESIGATDVETYIASGNVRLSSPLRSRSEVEAALEEAYAANRGFEVPTIVLTQAALREVVADADGLRAEFGEPATHYVSLLKQEPDPDAVAALQARQIDGERLVVRGRAAHMLLDTGFKNAKLSASNALPSLGVATARNVTTVRTLAERWC